MICKSVSILPNRDSYNTYCECVIFEVNDESITIVLGDRRIEFDPEDVRKLLLISEI